MFNEVGFVCVLLMGVMTVINSKHNHKIAEINEVNFYVSYDITVSKQCISERVNHGTTSYGWSYTPDAVFQRTLA